MNTGIKSSIAIITLAVSGNALAGADCTAEPQEKWMSHADMQRQILQMGYTIDRFKTDGNCYEIYGRNGAKEKVEVYFNPVNGKIVKEEIED